SDTLLFELRTTDASGAYVNPYKVDRVTIYFVERGFWAENTRKYESGGFDTFYKDLQPVAVFGTDTFPAWLSTDTANAFLEKKDFDDSGNPVVGFFTLTWSPELPREGDYFICWTWTPIAAGTQLSFYLQFAIHGDTKSTTSIPTHFTPPEKYP